MFIHKIMAPCLMPHYPLFCMYTDSWCLHLVLRVYKYVYSEHFPSLPKSEQSVFFSCVNTCRNLHATNSLFKNTDLWKIIKKDKCSAIDLSRYEIDLHLGLCRISKQSENIFMDVDFQIKNICHHRIGNEILN